jgi:hypothetical protein
MNHLWRCGAVALMINLCGAGAVLAEDGEPDLLGEFGDWSAHTYNAPDTRVCFVSSQPKSSEPKNVKRGPAFLQITKMPKRGVKGMVSTLIGYPFKKGEKVTLTVNDIEIEMFSEGEHAWVGPAEDEKSAIAAMKNGVSLVVTGTSWRGTRTSDTYSLNGISAALAKIDSVCK